MNIKKYMLSGSSYMYNNYFLGSDHIPVIKEIKLTNDNSIKVLSWNILHQTYLEKNAELINKSAIKRQFDNLINLENNKLTDYKDRIQLINLKKNRDKLLNIPQTNEIKQKKDRIDKLIKKINKKIREEINMKFIKKFIEDEIDIIGLQEVSDDILDNINKLLQDNNKYNVSSNKDNIFEKNKNDNRTNDNQVIIYNKQKLEINNFNNKIWYYTEDDLIRNFWKIKKENKKNQNEITKIEKNLEYYTLKNNIEYPTKLDITKNIIEEQLKLYNSVKEDRLYLTNNKFNKRILLYCFNIKGTDKYLHFINTHVAYNTNDQYIKYLIDIIYNVFNLCNFYKLIVIGDYNFTLFSNDIIENYTKSYLIDLEKTPNLIKNKNILNSDVTDSNSSNTYIYDEKSKSIIKYKLPQNNNSYFSHISNEAYDESAKHKEFGSYVLYDNILCFSNNS